MRFIKPLHKPELETLREMHHQHPLAWTRHRAQAILLSAQGYRVQEIATIHGVCRQTTSSWLQAWEKKGLVGLMDEARSGRPRKLQPDEEAQVLMWLEAEPRSIKQVQAKLAKRSGKVVSTSTIKRLCQRAGLVWKRLKKSLKDKRDPQAFEDSAERLMKLIERDAAGEIELVYVDESGVSLTPCVPYAWQPTGETRTLPTATSRRLNILGFLNRAGEFESVVFEDTINTAVVVACVDEFIWQRPPEAKDVVLVMDNASMHKSGEFEDQLERWARQGLTIEFIAPYSPELNLIEILWRKLKYEWLPLSAYESFACLKDNLFEVLANIGTKHRIVFS